MNNHVSPNIQDDRIERLVTPSSEVFFDKFKTAAIARDFTSYSSLLDAATSAKAKSLFPFINVDEGARILDVGSGTGDLGELAARQFSHASIYCLDASHEMLDISETRRSRINLVYGDAAEKIFPNDTFDAVYSSTCGHEIESFGGPGSMQKTLGRVFDSLKPGGTFVMRDFCKPESKEILLKILEPGPSFKTLLNESYVLNSNYSTCSSQEVFLHYWSEMQKQGGFDYSVVNHRDEEYVRLSLEWAAEFYQRKDYKLNFLNEAKEKYGYWTLEEGRAAMEKAGFSNIQIIPEYNSWILKNRLVGKIDLYDPTDPDMVPLAFPPTHMILVGEKPGNLFPPSSENSDILPSINYEAIIQEIEVFSDHIKIGQKTFPIRPNMELSGSKRDVYICSDENSVLKVPRSDSLNAHSSFKAMFQTITRKNILEEYDVPSLKILDWDRTGPPYRYLTQERVSQNSVCAANLLQSHALTEIDIQQMAEIVNRFEQRKEYQLDTNPFNWYRVQNADGTTQMTYVDGKVYLYASEWSFAKVGLLQWILPELTSDVSHRSATIPKVTLVENPKAWWDLQKPLPQWWSKHLLKELQPPNKV